jgi:hypothetical protein
MRTPGGTGSRQAPHHLEHPAQRSSIDVRTDADDSRAERDLDPARLSRVRAVLRTTTGTNAGASRAAGAASCWRQTKSWLACSP